MDDLVYLEKHEHSKNLHRFYRVLIEADLFGKWVLTREWGRVGQGGGHIVVKEYENLEDARQDMEQKVQEKVKRGYRIA
jgi:predicted DNA-binding WGR domain protein